MSAMGDLLQLIEQEIPGGRKHLKESHANLENVACYCEENYVQARDKRHALEETKNYTTQSLASVAYQINTLATNFLHLLDLQMNQLNDMESSVNHISQTVMIHKEKVARREIGVLTTNKTTTRPPGVKTPGIVFPEQPERPVKYVRKPIDYGVLDEIGHGVKQSQPQNPVKRRSSSSGSKTITQAPGGQAPTTKPPNPPNSGIYSRPSGGTGTLTRQTSSPYRTPAPPVSPPALPSHYAPNYPKQAPPPQQQAPPPQQQQAPPAGPVSRSEVTSGYAKGRAMGIPPQGPPPVPPTGMVHPMAHENVGYLSSHALVGQQQVPPPTPPLPPLPEDTFQIRSSIGEPPPPPPPDAPFGVRNSARIGNTSPPLPPPPIHGMGSYDMAPPPPNFDMDRPRGSGYRGIPSQFEDPNDWKPTEYIERVVAIYDYKKDKEDELSFTEGSTIYVVKKNDDGWWEGVLNGVTGLFPGNYVEPCI